MRFLTTSSPVGAARLTTQPAGPAALVEVGDARGGHRGHVGHALGVDASQVGTEHDVGKLEQRVVGPGRLGVEDVQARAAEMTAGQALVQIRLDHQAASGRVDEQGARLHPGERGAVEQAAGRGGRRQVEADDVRGAQQLSRSTRSTPSFASNSPAGAGSKAITRISKARAATRRPGRSVPGRRCPGSSPARAAPASGPSRRPG